MGRAEKDEEGEGERGKSSKIRTWCQTGQFRFSCSLHAMWPHFQCTGRRRAGGQTSFPGNGMGGARRRGENAWEGGREPGGCSVEILPF